MRNGLNGAGTLTDAIQQLTVKYHCLDSGSAEISLTIPVGVYNDVHFSWIKNCNKDYVEGFTLRSADRANLAVS